MASVPYLSPDATPSADYARPIAAHWCGQTQPHAAHEWQTPPAYGAATFIQTYQCGGYVIQPAGTCASCGLAGNEDERGWTITESGPVGIVCPTCSIPPGSSERGGA